MELPSVFALPSCFHEFLSSSKSQPWQKLTKGHLRIVTIVLLGTSIFLALNSAFGQLSRPRLQRLDTFPRKIWQSWKVDPLRFEDRDIMRTRSWTGLNPSHRYEVLTDGNAMPWVELHFGPSGYNRPDIVSTYKALESNLKIIQADLLRYLIMYVEGGVWTDIDVQAITPVDSFIPKGIDQSEVQMVIGIETDEPDFKHHPVLGSKAQSFCQWTFMCKPRLTVMLRLIDNILVRLSKLATEQRKPISQLHLDFDEVLSGTGPSAFTEAILSEMTRKTKIQVTWDTFHDITDSILVGGILVLPAEAFAAGTGHSKSGNHGSRRALVKHHFHASSWTTRHPRKKHPIYGEVERCNWDMECVKLWDANTAFYNSLPERDQQRMIGMKRLQEAQSEQLALPGGELQGSISGAKPVQPKDKGPPDLGATTQYLRHIIEEESMNVASSSKAEDSTETKTKADAEQNNDAQIDLAAIARFLGQTVHENPAEANKVPAAISETDMDGTKDHPIDIIASGHNAGQSVEDHVTQPMEKPPFDAKPRIDGVTTSAVDAISIPSAVKERPPVENVGSYSVAHEGSTSEKPGKDLVKAEEQTKVSNGQPLQRSPVALNALSSEVTDDIDGILSESPTMRTVAGTVELREKVAVRNIRRGNAKMDIEEDVEDIKNTNDAWDSRDDVPLNIPLRKASIFSHLW